MVPYISQISKALLWSNVVFYTLEKLSANYGLPLVTTDKVLSKHSVAQSLHSTVMQLQQRLALHRK